MAPREKLGAIVRGEARRGEDGAQGIIRERSRIQSFARREQWTRLMANGVSVEPVPSVLTQA